MSKQSDFDTDNGASHGHADFHGSAIIDKIHRGVIYGRKGNARKKDTEIEFFANGLSLGTIPIDVDTAVPFLLRVPQHLILEAPVTIRGRDAAGNAVSNCEVVLADAAAVDAALSAGHGVVVFEGGMLRGSLHDVNPDALPLVITATVGGRPVASTEIRRPLRSNASDGAFPFLLPLPNEVFNLSSTTLSVGLSGSTAEFEGSPIIVFATHGKSIEARLTHLEDTNIELKATVETLRSSILSDIGRQFYNLIVPRVDAVVETQRTALERQMARLWLEVIGKDQPAMPKPAPPLTARISLSESFVGYGWITASGEIGGQKWLRERAFLIAEVNPEEDVLLTVTGDDMISPGALDALRISVNGHLIRIWTAQNGMMSSGWEAYGIIERASLGAEGTVNIEFECPVYGTRRFERGDVLASLSVAEVRLESGRNVEGTGPGMLTDQTCLVGFHGREVTDDGLPFRWLGPRGLLLIRQPDSSEATSIRIGGPFTLNPKVAESFQVRLMEGNCFRDMTIEYHHGWCASLDFAPKRSGAPALYLIALNADAQRASSKDSRLLSVALAHIDIEKCN